MKYFNNESVKSYLRKEKLRVRKLHKWHYWFAWFPVKLTDKNGRKTNHTFWLSWVERQSIGFYPQKIFDFKYREPINKKSNKG